LGFRRETRLQKRSFLVQPLIVPRARSAWAALIVSLLMMLPCGARAAEAPPAAPAPASVKTSAHADIGQGFARIVFDLPGEPKVEAAIDYGVLVVKFIAPVDVDRDQLKTELGPYVSMIRQDPDGTTLRFALRGPLRLIKTLVGRQAAIDLIPPRYTQEPPPFHGLVAQEATGPDLAPAGIIPSEAEERKEFASFAAPTPLDLLPIRVGINPTYTRIAFDWNLPTDYAVEHHGNEIVIRFSRAARIDLAQLKTDPPKYVKSVDAQMLDGKLVVILELAPDIDAQDFRDGLRVVLDLTPKAPTGDNMAGVGPLGDDAAAFAPPKPLASAHPPSAPLAGGDAEAVLTGKSTEPVAPKAEPDAPAPAAAAQSEPVIVAPPSPGHLGLTADDKGVTIAVAFPDQVAAAAFRRGDELWLVFDSDQPLSADPPAREITPFVGNIAVGTEDGAQVARIELKTDALIDAKAEGNAWSIRLADQVETPGAAIAVSRETSASGGPRLRLKADAAKLHWLSDPALGDFVLVGTAKGAIRNIPIERQFVELSALATAQGVAVIPFSENLSARLESGDVIIDAEGGLALTVSDTVERGSTRSPVERVQNPAFLDFANWQRGGSKELVKTRQALLEAVLKADDKHRNLARLDLARFYIANEFDAEALGVLRIMAKEDARVENAAAYHALRGAALFMLGRADEAEPELADGSLATEPDIAVWRGAAAAAARHWDAAAEAFGASEGIIPRYPVTWQARFRLLQAQSALSRNDLPAAEKALTATPPEGLTPGLRAMSDYIGGKILEGQGRGEEALKRYGLAAAGPRGEAQARARLAEADLAVKLGKMDQKTAIEKLEQLRYDWRGDALELEVLGMLGRHYIADRRYREGLGIMHAAVSYFPKEQLSGVIAQDMSDAFRALFLEGGADVLPPVEALALFYDFRELTPLGADGDDMVRRLAERLVVVDLLPQAADLLQHQVDSRLQGAARAQVASRLAAIYLMDHKPEDALRNIRATRQAQLPDWLDAERRLLEARALLDLKQYDFALEVLLNDTSPEAERIRADVYWGANNWGAAAEHIEQVLTDRWRQAAPLGADERLNVMRAAICYFFNKDSFGLSSLRERYGTHMKDSPDEAAFELVTAKPDVSSDDVGVVAKRIAAADTLDAFMRAFRARYADKDQTATAKTN
jgi:hypothetical protein